MILRECRPGIGGKKVYRLTDRFSTGFAGTGYGGDRLYVVTLVDCFDPPLYLVRADFIEEAIDIAVECLCESIEDYPSFADDYGITHHDLTHPGVNGEYPNLPPGITSSPSGRLVSSDDDIHIYQIAGPVES